MTIFCPEPVRYNDAATKHCIPDNWTKCAGSIVTRGCGDPVNKFS